VQNLTGRQDDDNVDSVGAIRLSILHGHTARKMNKQYISILSLL